MSSFLWWGLLALLVIFILFKWNNYRTKLAYLFIVLGIGFLLVTGFMVFSGGEVNFSTLDGVSSAAKTYVSWLVNAGSNIVEISSYVFNQEWKGDELVNATVSSG
ncbi:MAG: hypothetical protein WDZ69_02035 [Candidatus Pacearchaeota archaeon]